MAELGHSASLRLEAMLASQVSDKDTIKEKRMLSFAGRDRELK